MLITELREKRLADFSEKGQILRKKTRVIFDASTHQYWLNDDSVFTDLVLYTLLENPYDDRIVFSIKMGTDDEIRMVKEKIFKIIPKLIWLGEEIGRSVMFDVVDELDKGEFAKKKAERIKKEPKKKEDK